MEKELKTSYYNFLISIIAFIKNLKGSLEIKVIKYRLIKSFTEFSVDYKKISNASSISDKTNTVNKAIISLSEIVKWLTISLELDSADSEEASKLIYTAIEIKDILSTLPNSQDEID